MIHYNNGGVVVRDMEWADIGILAGNAKDPNLHRLYEDEFPFHPRFPLASRDLGACAMLVCEAEGEIAGHASLYWSAQWGAYEYMDVPQIDDLNVSEKFRRRGLGSRLLDVCEQLAADRADRICLPLGLAQASGHALRMLVRRGYVPDGHGFWRSDMSIPAGASIRIDDDVHLYLIKELKK